MGNKFKYIADAVLSKLLESDEECQHCGKKDRDVYAFNGEIINPNLSFDVELAKDEPEIYYACEECIKSGNLIPDEYIEDEIKRKSPDTMQGIIEGVEFRQKPYVMFLQNPEWPYCCGDMTELIGETPLEGTHFDEYKCWEPMSPAVSEFQLKDFYPLGKLDVLYTMNLFHCNECSSKYWNFQYSGLFWPGPV